MIERVVPGMRERSFGRIVSVSSSAAREPIPTLMLSNSHRPGLLGAFKTLARKLAADGITFNTILPGRIATDRIAHLHGSIEEAEKVARDEIPAGRLGNRGGDRRRGGVPLLRARELHHRSGPAGGRRADEEHLTHGAPNRPPPQARSLREWPSRLSASSGPRAIASSSSAAGPGCAATAS